MPFENFRPRRFIQRLTALATCPNMSSGIARFTSDSRYIRARPGSPTSSEMVVQWKIEGESLAEGQDYAVRLALADQEGAGLDIVTDGEQRRRHYV